MNIVGQRVVHKVFGPGVVQSRQEQTMRILFEDAGEKSFVYPDAFEIFLTIPDQNLQRQIAGEIDAIRRKEQQEREERQLEWERRQEEQRRGALELAKLRRKNAKAAPAKSRSRTS